MWARISSFCQKGEETIPEEWEHLQEYIRECPHHGIKEWLLIQGFYHGLTPDVCSHLDAAARGSFTSLNVAQAKKLIENIVTNQEWNDERPKPKKRGTDTIQEVNAISQKMELLMKKREETSNFKKDREAIQQYTSTRVVKAIQRCEVQEETPEVVSAFDNGQGNFQKSSWPTLRDLVVNQAKINEGINKRLLANDKTLELLTSKMDSLASAVQDQ